MNEIKEFFNNLARKWDNNITPDDRLRAKNLINDIGLKEKMKVLDLACGTGIVSEYIEDIINVPMLSIDLSDEMISIANEKNKNKNITFKNIDLYDLNDKFDYIICFNAYPHFIDKEKFKNKIYDLLNDKGKLAILHNLSRKRLDMHHSQITNISRTLNEVNLEASYYLPQFKIIEAYEDDESYKIILEKE